MLTFAYMVTLDDIMVTFASYHRCYIDAYYIFQCANPL